MKYIKIFEDFNDDKLDKLSDIFIDFEDEKWHVVKPIYRKIVPDRDDWTGNFVSTKVRNIFGNTFIEYGNDVMMSKGEKKWHTKDALLVYLSNVAYIKDMDGKSIIKHWEELDDSIREKINKISLRVKPLNISLYGVVGKWYQLGKASHPDYANEPFYGYDMLTNHITFAFFYE